MIVKPLEIDFSQPLPAIGVTKVKVGDNSPITSAIVDFETRTVALTIHGKKNVFIVPFERVLAFQIESFDAITDVGGETSGKENDGPRPGAKPAARGRKSASAV